MGLMGVRSSRRKHSGALPLTGASVTSASRRCYLTRREFPACGALDEWRRAHPGCIQDSQVSRTDGLGLMVTGKPWISRNTVVMTPTLLRYIQEFGRDSRRVAAVMAVRSRALPSGSINRTDEAVVLCRWLASRFCHR